MEKAEPRSARESPRDGLGNRGARERRWAEMWEELIQGEHLLLEQCQTGEILLFIAVSICLGAPIPSRAVSPTSAFAQINPSIFLPL